MTTMTREQTEALIAEVLEVYPEKAQTMGKRCINIFCFTGNLILLSRWHRAQRSHIVKAVGYFYEYYPYIF